MKLVALGGISFDHPDGKGAKVRVFDLDNPKNKGEIFLGLSKRNPKDTPDDAIGHALALGRALVAAGNDLILRAEETSEVQSMMSSDPELALLLLQKAAEQRGDRLPQERTRLWSIQPGDWVTVSGSHDGSFHMVERSEHAPWQLSCRPSHSYWSNELIRETPGVRTIRCPECLRSEIEYELSRAPRLPLV